MVWQQWHVVGCYIEPNNASTIEKVVAAISRRTRGAEILVTVDFNAKLVYPKGIMHMEDIVASLSSSLLDQ